MATVEINEKNFEQYADDGIVLLDMWASWCGPCKAFGPVFEAAAERHPDVVFGKVNTEEQPELARSFGVRAIPTLVAMRDGVILMAQPGALPGSAIDEIVNKARSLDMDEVRSQIEQRKAKAG
ncbi:MAG: thioredoxin family protein [Myxococcota bacterium]